jgi:zinc/manganese transport system permease protein
MDDFLFAPFVDFAFMRRALVGCWALSLGAAPVGVFLMLRRMTLTGDAMAHAILPGAALGYLVAGLSVLAMTAGGLVAGLAVALLSSLVARSTVLREDASLAVLYLISLSLGVLMISAKGSNIDLLHVLFGGVLALDDAALWLIVSIATVSTLVLAAIFRPLVLECLDPGFLRSVSGLSAATHMVFMGLVVLNLVGGFHALGTLLAVALMILPAATARFWARGLSAMLGVAVLAAALASTVGLLVSYYADTAAGPTVVLTLGAGYLVSLLAGPVGSLGARWWPRRHLEA